MDQPFIVTKEHRRFTEFANAVQKRAHHRHLPRRRRLGSASEKPTPPAATQTGMPWNPT